MSTLVLALPAAAPLLVYSPQATPFVSPELKRGRELAQILDYCVEAGMGDDLAPAEHESFCRLQEKVRRDPELVGLLPFVIDLDHIG